MSALSVAEEAWLASTNGGNVREFYAELGVELRGDGQEAAASCFANAQMHNRGDRNPSCSVNLATGVFKCHGCGVHGNPYQAALAVGMTERRAADLARQYGLFLEAVKTEPAPRLPDERQLRKWRQALTGSDMLMRRCWEVKGWTPRAIVRCGLGWDGERITFTYRDKRLKKTGVVRYLPNASRKMLALPGSKRGLFPAPEVLSKRRPLYVVEGEPAAVSVWSLGLQAVGIPGAGSWRREWVHRLLGFNMIVLPDCDAPGRDLAWQVQAGVPNVRVVDLDPRCDDGTDVGDWITGAAGEGGLAQMRRLLERLAA